jgi:hypothetical protein
MAREGIMEEPISIQEQNATWEDEFSESARKAMMAYEEHMLTKNITLARATALKRQKIENQYRIYRLSREIVDMRARENQIAIVLIVAALVYVLGLPW